MQVGVCIRVSTEDQAKAEYPKNHETNARIYAGLKEFIRRKTGGTLPILFAQKGSLLRMKIIIFLCALGMWSSRCIQHQQHEMERLLPRVC